MVMRASEPVPEDEEEDVEEAVLENKLTLDIVAEGFWLFNTAFDFFYNRIPSVIWVLKLKHMWKKNIGYCIETFFRVMKKQRSQTEISMYFHKAAWMYLPPWPPLTPPPSLQPPRQQGQALLFLLLLLSLLGVKMARMKTFLIHLH